MRGMFLNFLYLVIIELRKIIKYIKMQKSKDMFGIVPKVLNPFQIRGGLS
jgi:hypothetical protein